MLSKRRNEAISARHLTPKQISHEIHQTNPATCPNRGYGQHPPLSAPLETQILQAKLILNVDARRRCSLLVHSVGVAADQPWVRRTAGNLQSDAKVRVYPGVDKARTAAYATYAADVWLRSQVT